ncbi:hypothetical protein [Listeria booriae]|uniref:hypothetical protein n=1 Tax=Listeria booriae TaxID=1552123 RepID=UPI00162527E7|nr:hypothetical protein [Listeria booriae]MBC2306231.1 hypothetical protein [Listeria booriae]
MGKTRKSIIDMTTDEARMFLLKGESYITSSLPAYLNMDGILNIAKDMVWINKIRLISKNFLD